MPIEIKYTDDGLGSLLIGEGIVTGNEILDAIAIRFSSMDKIKKYIYGLADYTGVEEFHVTNTEIDLIAQKDIEVAQINPNLIFAIVAHGDLVFGLGRMFEVFAGKSGWAIEVFRALDQAVLWIRNSIKEKHNRDVNPGGMLNEEI